MHFKNLNITYRGLVILLAIFFIYSCKQENKEDYTIDIATYSPKQLTYPTEAVVIPDSIQQQYYDHYYLPWTSSANDVLEDLQRFPGKEMAYLNNYLNDDAWYGENKKPHTLNQREAIVANANASTFPNFLKKGITIAHTDLRRVPTQRPGFDVYAKAGEGYPFDYFQETNLWASTPLLLVHQTKDKQWCYVVSPYYKGWVAMRDIAIADEDFIADWMTYPTGVPVKDNIGLSATNSQYGITTKIGMLLPYEEGNKNDTVLKVYYAAADQYQYAQLMTAEIMRDLIAFNGQSFDHSTLQALVAELLGVPYGWGGQLENRDCSSMIRDLLSAYRVWLPRDSKDQMAVGNHLELEGSASDKIETIKTHGIPFLTILRKKGHNMLYVGDDVDGTPLILHAVWGLKPFYTNAQLANDLKRYPLEGMHQEDNGQLRGRYIIGETVITRVDIGSKERHFVDAVIDEIYAMTTLLQ